MRFSLYSPRSHETRPVLGPAAPAASDPRRSGDPQLSPAARARGGVLGHRLRAPRAPPARRRVPRRRRRPGVFSIRAEGASGGRRCRERDPRGRVFAAALSLEGARGEVVRRGRPNAARLGRGPRLPRGTARARLGPARLDRFSQPRFPDLEPHGGNGVFAGGPRVRFPAGSARAGVRAGPPEAGGGDLLRLRPGRGGDPGARARRIAARRSQRGRSRALPVPGSPRRGQPRRGESPGRRRPSLRGRLELASQLRGSALVRGASLAARAVAGTARAGRNPRSGRGVRPQADRSRVDLSRGGGRHAPRLVLGQTRRSSLCVRAGERA